MASYSDDFNAYSDGPLANNAAWENTVGGGLEVFSNQVAEDPGSGFQTSSVTTATANFAADGEAQVDVVTFGSFDFCGVGYRTSTNNGYYVFAGDGEYSLVSVTGATTQTEIGSYNIVTPASGHKIKIVCSGTTISAELDTGSGFSQIISVTNSDHSTGQPGLYYDRQSSNASRMDNFSAVDSATASVTITEGSAAFGDTINFSTAGLSTLTSWTVSDGTNTINLTSGTDTSAVVPAIGNDVSRLLTGTVTVTVGDGTDTAQDTFTLTPPSGYSSVVLTSGFDTSENSYLFNYGGTPAIGDEFLYVTAEATLNSDGSWETPGAGTTTVYGIDATDGFMESFALITGLPVASGDDTSIQFLKSEYFKSQSGLSDVSLQDAEIAFYRQQLSVSDGNLNDLKLAFLQQELSVSSGHVQDLYKQYLLTEPGVSGDDINDLEAQFYASKLGV